MLRRAQSNIIEKHKMLMYLSHVSDMWDHGSDSITRYLLAQAYKKMGKTDEAKRELDVVSRMRSATQ
jgi:hypothetical protein